MVVCVAGRTVILAQFANKLLTKRGKWVGAESWGIGPFTVTRVREQVLLTDVSHFAKKCLLLGFLRARNFLLLVFRLLPTGTGVEFLHGFGERIRLLAEILLIHHAIRANHECHHAR